MIVPTYLIIPPAILALIVYLGLYYRENPDNRITDPRFLLALGCFVVVSGQMFMLIQGYDQTVSSVLLCLAALGLLAVAVWMVFDNPYLISRKR